jgi:hypothetical protein
MLKKISVLVVFICLGSLSAQTFIGKLNPFASGVKKSYAGQDTLKVLAVMVNFQQDKDETTYGNGKFGSIYTKDYGSDIIDPLPHDQSYFESHLEFVKNYYNKVSDGKFNVVYKVLPDTLTLSMTMKNYSPAVNSGDFTTLANFSKEVWALAVAAYPDFDFSQYNLFTIFHAGVGRDISLPGSLGNERDLPSVYLGLNSLKKIYNNNSFQGFPLKNGGFITNSMIIPETESMEVESNGEKYLYEISINGLLVASVASHLGLPDLFNTKTGNSAIGRMGLMDGQSIFAYNGLFPPEPSAWEKIFLGFAEADSIQQGESLNNISIDNNKIIKVPINSSEYFLIENRERDINGDGAKITYRLNGQEYTKTFLKDTTGFYSSGIDSLSGVVTDVDEFDWAMPGNGILIWHIDENVINSQLADNKINADSDHRGVDVEEADGIQDIGETFYDIFGNKIIGEGDKHDFWYSGNDAQFYKNVFSPDTRPNTNSNSGANSLITFSNFSVPGKTMTFSIAYGDSIVRPLYAAPVSLPAGTITLSGSSKSGLSVDVLVDSSLYLIQQGKTSLIADKFSAFKPAVATIGNNIYTIGAYGSSINIYSHSTGLVNTMNTEGNDVVSAPPVIYGEQLILGTVNGNVLTYIIKADDSALYLGAGSGEGPVKKIARNDLAMVVLSADKVYVDNSVLVSYPVPASSLTPYPGSPEKLNNSAIDNIKDVALSGAKPVILYSDRIDYINNSKTYSFAAGKNEKLSVADLKNDGDNYILYTNGKKLEAVNSTGASAVNFPFTDPADSGFTGTPLAANIQGDSKAEVIAYTVDGRIFAIDGGTGKVVNGFPVSAGAALKSTPVIFNYNGEAVLAAVDVKNNFHSWIIGAAQADLFWSEENGNSGNTSAVGSAEKTVTVNEFFPESKVYNYPNPVYEGQTAIRYFVSEDSKINIKIFDLAGDFVAEFNNDARGGFDNETIWNVADIQSGIYLARVEAVSSSGKTENKVIKIAVIK